MSNEWREYAIGEIAEVVGGGTPSTSDPENFDGDIPWITPKDLSTHMSRFVSRGERNISKKGLQNSSAKLLPAGAVLLTTRAPVGYIAIASNSLTTNQGFRSLVLNDQFDSQFVYYLLKANIKTLIANASGTTFGELSGSTLKKLKFKFPPYQEQRAIAHILGTLDDKIELNRRMCETLEQMARALFKSWFVDFEPVRAKMSDRWKKGQSLSGLPAHLWDLFPDRLVPSELGEIPEGWKVGFLGDIADNPRRGIQPKQIELGTPYIALENMPKRSIAIYEWVVSRGLESNKFQFGKGEILFGKLRPYFHKVGVAPIDGICSTDIVVVAPKEPNWFALVLGVVSSDKFVEYTNAGSTGTKMPRTSWADMACYMVALPTEPVATASTYLIQPLVEQIIKYIHESRILAALRDALLPKLISGEIRAKEAE